MFSSELGKGDNRNKILVNRIKNNAEIVTEIKQKYFRQSDNTLNMLMTPTNEAQPAEG
jgi:hypothetical protein